MASYFACGNKYSCYITGKEFLDWLNEEEEDRVEITGICIQNTFKVCVSSVNRQKGVRELSVRFYSRSFLEKSFFSKSLTRTNILSTLHVFSCTPVRFDIMFLDVTCNYRDAIQSRKKNEWDIRRRTQGPRRKTREIKVKNSVNGCFTFRAKTTWMKLEDAILPCTSIQSTRQVYITTTVPCLFFSRLHHASMIIKHFIIQLMHNIYYVDTIKIIKYLKVLQHVSDHRGSVIREACTVLG